MRKINNGRETLVCDRCKQKIVEGFPGDRKLTADWIIKVNKDQTELHYCCKECKKVHSPTAR